MQGHVSVRLGATAEPIALAVAKTHCKIDADLTEDDDLVAGLIAAARQRAEDMTSRVLLTRGLKATFPGFPQGGGRPYYGRDAALSARSSRSATQLLLSAPARRVLTVTYIDAPASAQLLAAATYDVDLDDLPGILSLAHGASWPTTLPHPAAVAVNFIAGYATPFTVDAGGATLRAIGHPFVVGDTARGSSSGGALPANMQAKMDYYVVEVAGATLKLAAEPDGDPIVFGTDATGLSFLGEIPAAFNQAMLLMIGHWYNHREEVSDFQLFEVPKAVDSLLAPLRVLGF
jgi:hypothetical protein